MIDLLIAAAIGFVFGSLFGIFLVALLISIDNRKNKRRDDHD